MEKQQIIQLLSGAAGSVGFGLIFNLRKKYLPLVAAGGFLGWLVYLLCSINKNHCYIFYNVNQCLRKHNICKIFLIITDISDRRYR